MTEGTTTPTITLTVREIADLAVFAGLTVDDSDIDFENQELTITACPDSGLPDDDGSNVSHYRWIACLTEYPEEGYIGLGEEQKP